MGNCGWNARSQRQSLKAGKAGDWAVLLKNDTRKGWSSVKLRECHSEVEQDDEERKNICAADFEEKHGLPGSGSSCQSKDREGWSHCCTHALMSSVPAGDWSTATSFRKRSSATGDVPHVSASRIGEIRKESWSSEGNTGRREAKVFRAHAPPHGVCDNLVNALELFANQQTGSDSSGGHAG